jgi:stage V sporulation protein D (sporulation-specific penicillin-binding protein)
MSLDSLNAVELATNSFGQSFNVTMVQMAAAYSSLVNGGNYYQPHIMKKIVNDNGATVKDFDKLLVRQTVSEKTSEFIQKYMYQTVEAGTANGAKVEGYAIGGKTGTAQKLPRDAKTYVVSFLGAVPAINPEIVIYVMIDEPQNVVKQADSSIATTFASRIMKNLLPALGIFPEGEIDYLLPTDNETTGDGEQGNTTTPDTENTGNAGNNESGEAGENSENNQNTEDNDELTNPESQPNENDTQTNGDDTKEDSEIPDDASNTNEDAGEDSQNSQTNGDEGEPDTEIDNANQPEGQADIPSGENEFNPDALE